MSQLQLIGIVAAIISAILGVYSLIIKSLYKVYKDACSKVEENCRYFWSDAKKAHISEQLKRLKQFYLESQDPKSLYYKKENRLADM